MSVQFGAPEGVAGGTDTPGPAAELDIRVDVVRVYVAAPRDWGQGKTEARAVEAAWMENLLTAIKETWQWAVILHDGCPTGGSRIIEEVWRGAFGLPTEIYRPDWETCVASCANATDTLAEPHRRPRKDKAHGTGESFCYTADERTVRRLFHPLSTKRPHRVIGVVTDHSRVTRFTTRLADEVGIPSKRYAPRWFGDMFRDRTDQ